jgi:hypothetical protein
VRLGTRHGDEGSAVIEFVSLGLLLMLPLVYLVLCLGRVQAATFAADGAAREAARAFVTSADQQDGEARAAVAVRLGLLDHGFYVDPRQALTLQCSATPCLQPRQRVTARVRLEVVLPGVPRFFDRVVPTRVSVGARQLAVVDAYRALRP